MHKPLTGLVSSNFSVDDRAADPGICNVFDSDTRNWDECDYLVIGLQLSTVTNISYLNFNYGAVLEVS